MLYPDFKRYVASHDLLTEGERVILAVSGGVDSMVMMDLVSRIARPMDLNVCVAHVNHGLRGRQSDMDEGLVKEETARLGFDFASRRAPPKKDQNLQDSARTARFSFFRRLARKSGASKVLLAHNRGDQAETVLMHLIRGSGLAGLCGMSPVSSAEGLIVVRPMLFAPRKAIARYARERGVRFREDRTNRTLKYRRNEIRHRLMPLLAGFNPRIEESLAAMAKTLADDECGLDLIAKASFYEVCSRAAKGRVSLRAEDFRAMPEAIRSRMLAVAWHKATGKKADLNRDQIERMDLIALSGKGQGAYGLRAPWEFRMSKGLIVIQRRPAR